MHYTNYIRISEIQIYSSSAVQDIQQTNYAKLANAAKQLFPAIIRELITIKEPPHTLFNDIITNRYLSKQFRADELILISNIIGYSEFNMQLIFKLFRCLKIIPPPTQGWYHSIAPCQTEVTPGDDLERIRRLRNDILRSGNIQVTSTELSEFFKHFKDIAGRLEIYLEKKPGAFMDKFIDLESCCMDEEIMYCRRLHTVPKSDEVYEKRLDVVEKKISALTKSSK